MSDYPQTPQFTHLNTPIGAEYSLKGLAVEGEIPADVRGSFFRAVPDPAFPPYVRDDNFLSGDGTLSRVRFNAISGSSANGSPPERCDWRRVRA